MFRTLLASLAVTAVDMVLVGTDRRHEMGPEDAEAAESEEKEAAPA